MPPLASIPRRIAARLIDGAIIGFVWVVPMAVTGHIDTDGLDVSTWLANAVWVTWIAYEVLLVMLTGQTLGKRILGVQVVDGTTGAVPNADQAVRRAGVYVDTRAGATKEAGDITQPLANGTIGAADIIGDLFELCRGEQTGRPPGDRTGITLFKSVGAALEDLAAAELVVDR